MFFVRDQRSGARAFTLIELLVVIIILAILAAVVIPKVIGRTEDARISKTTADIKSLDSALEMYKLDTGSYPSSDQGLNALINNMAQAPKWNGPYIKGGLPHDGWGHEYIYRFPGEHGEFDIMSAGADGQPGTADDMGNWETGR